MHDHSSTTGDNRPEPSRSRVGLTFNPGQLAKELGALFLLVGGVFLALSLMSFDRADPGWSVSSAAEQYHNAAGRIGAWAADLALFLVGYGAYLVPFFLLLMSARLYKGLRSGEVFLQRALWLRIIGFLFGLVAISLLSQIHFSVTQGALPLDSGGALGRLLTPWVVQWTGMLGATLLLLALLMAGLTLLTGLSWLGLAEWVGWQTLRVVEGVLSLVKRPGPDGRGENGPLAGVSSPLRDDPPFIMPASWTQLEPVLDAPRAEPASLVRTVRSSTDAVEQAPVPLPAATPSPVAPVPRTPAPSRPEAPRRPARAPVGVQEGRPSLTLLDPPTPHQEGYSAQALEEMSRLIETRLREYGVQVEVVAAHPGPVITRFELQPAAGVKVSQISNLAKDLARSLSTVSVRVVEVIPGKSTVGLEIPNPRRDVISFGELLSSPKFQSAASPLTLALGKDIGGEAVMADLARMPHVLVAGTTGSGKSVGINAMLLSLLFKSPADEVRLILIDPKMLELSVYEGIPHLLAPVVTDMKEAANALRWAVGEMERRYRLMAALGVRNIAGFNARIREARTEGEPIVDPLWNPAEQLDPESPAPALETLPYIVVVVDEFADMMMVVGKKVEELIARLAQKARAAGIHLVLATQRPSVDVITGLIKANIPTRIAFQVSSKIDSRTILDQMGAEALLGYGDMLYLPPGTGLPMRVHGAFVSDEEVHRVVEALKTLGAPRYIEDILEDQSASVVLPGEKSAGDEEAGESDPLYDEAVKIVTESRKASISYVQRRLKIGYNRAARMIEEMELAGVVGPLQPNGSREVVAPPPPGG